MRLPLAVLLAATAASAFSPVAGAQNPHAQGKQDVTLTASANPVTFSQPLVLKGSVKGAGAALPVTLQRRSPTATTFTNVSTGGTDNKGDYTFTTRPKAITVYRVVAATNPAKTSPELLVNVSPLVGFLVSDSTARPGQRVVFRGTVRPTHDGRTVQIQRKRPDGTWGTIIRATLTDAGSIYSNYRRRITVRTTATYRVRILGHDDHALGISRERVVTVG